MKEETRDMDEDDILDDKEVVMNQRVKDSTRNVPEPENAIPESGSFSRLKSEDMRKEIEKMSKKLEEDQIIKENDKEESSDQNNNASESEKGQPDSDSEEDKRLENMRDADKRRFNVNDILGDFDRDERGHPLIL